MNVAQPIRISGKDGWCGIVHSWFGGSPGEEDAHEITIRLDTGETVAVPDTVLQGRPDGSYYVPLSLEDLRGPPPPPAAPADGNVGDERRVIPVIHEELHVEKRKVATGGVRVHKTAREEEQTVDVPLIHEQVQVERVPVGRIVDGPVPVRHVGDTIVVPVVEEVLVVQKQLRLIEELHIRRTRSETRDPRTVTLRKEEATVERIDESESAEEGRDGADDIRPV